MKKNALIVALLAAAGFIATPAFAVDGTITITGEIKGLTCTVSGGPGTTPGTGGDFSVDLLPVQTTALAAAGNVAAAKPFSIMLGTGPGATCPDGTRAAILFDTTSTAINPATGNLANQATGTPATNVEVQILDSTNANAPINLAAGTASAEVTAAGGTALLPFQAQYIAVGGGATVGPVDTSVRYTVVFP
ncbi:fimbrial protein [Collimonas pratensis]|uniref:Fimbrial family protein n=1 Tax=Collimonas pratensis TaxID=279113 RepID=A0ABM5ZB68_9BURK|nr:fimbrial protein [Collimonas pratensis]AMP16318.1 fimbrial family protein [Collimonas pratensis]